MTTIEETPRHHRRPGPIRRAGRALSEQLRWLGRMLLFGAEAVAELPAAVLRHPREVARLITDVAFGRGLLTVAASTVLVSALLAAVIGVQIGLEGLQGLDIVGLAPLSGLLADYGNTRELAPLITAIGLGAQKGWRITAQVGAMRINGEVNALETMSNPNVRYLVSTRLAAITVLVIPMYLVALSGA